MPGYAKKKHFDIAWGRAKSSYIKSRLQAGYTPEGAQSSWLRERKRLKAKGIEYPRPYLSAIHSELSDDWALVAALEEAEAQGAGPSGTSTPKKKVRFQDDDSDDEYLNNVLDELIDGISDNDDTEPVNSNTTMTTMTTDVDMPSTSAAEGPSAPKRTATDAGLDTSLGPTAPGVNDTKGIGGGGGGLAGAGDNFYMNGFGDSTRPRDPQPYEYVDTYKRPFQVHTHFQDSIDQYSSYLSPTPIDAADKASIDADGGKFQTQYVKAVWNHNGVMVPYWFMEASMRTCDWNKPQDHIAWKLEEIGFYCPNMRLNILNNDRESTTQVAPAPPADARLWTFVDTYNDYGMVEAFSAADCTHNNLFNDEDFVDTALVDYELPTLGARQLLLDPAAATQILCERPWEYDTTNAIWASNDPNVIYNIKRHPHYKETTLKDMANMGLSYKVTAPVVRFPNIPITTPDMGARQAGIAKATDTMEMSKDVVHPWTTWATDIYHGQPLKPDFTETQLMGQMQYYATNQKSFSNPTDTQPWSADQKTEEIEFGTKRVQPIGISLKSQTGIGSEWPKNTKYRKTGRMTIDDGGKIEASHISKRPPIFMFGIYKEFEYKPTGSVPWVYYLYGQVVYYAKIRWYVQPNKHPVYLNIGLGGLYSNGWVGETGTNKPGRRTFLNNATNRRHTYKPMLNTTTVEQIAVWAPGQALV